MLDFSMSHPICCTQSNLHCNDRDYKNKPSIYCNEQQYPLQNLMYSGHDPPYMRTQLTKVQGDKELLTGLYCLFSQIVIVLSTLGKMRSSWWQWEEVVVAGPVANGSPLHCRGAVA